MDNFTTNDLIFLQGLKETFDTEDNSRVKDQALFLLKTLFSLISGIIRYKNHINLITVTISPYITYHLF